MVLPELCPLQLKALSAGVQLMISTFSISIAVLSLISARYFVMPLQSTVMFLRMIRDLFDVRNIRDALRLLPDKVYPSPSMVMV